MVWRKVILLSQRTRRRVDLQVVSYETEYKPQFRKFAPAIIEGGPTGIENPDTFKLICLGLRSPDALFQDDKFSIVHILSIITVHTVLLERISSF